MAGEWLKFEANTPEKQEVFSITVAMGWSDPDLTVGKLLKVWRWFDQQTISGNAPSVTLALLDHIVGVSGFAQAMCNVGWLVCLEGGISLPNFDRHNGKTAKERALTAKRVAKHKSNAQGSGQGNAAGVTSALPKEDKKREEVKPTPIPPGGGKERAAFSLKTYLQECKESGQQPIPENDPVFDYAQQAGISTEVLTLHWAEFRARYSQEGAKRYKAWRQVFGKSVRGNWFRLWYFGPNGDCLLTTAGIQAQRIADEQHRRAA